MLTFGSPSLSLIVPVAVSPPVASVRVAGSAQGHRERLAVRLVQPVDRRRYADRLRRLSRRELQLRRRHRRVVLARQRRPVRRRVAHRHRLAALPAQLHHERRRGSLDHHRRSRDAHLRLVVVVVDRPRRRLAGRQMPRSQERSTSPRTSLRPARPTHRHRRRYADRLRRSLRCKFKLRQPLPPCSRRRSPAPSRLPSCSSPSPSCGSPRSTPPRTTPRFPPSTTGAPVMLTFGSIVVVVDRPRRRLSAGRQLPRSQDRSTLP